MPVFPVYDLDGQFRSAAAARQIGDGPGAARVVARARPGGARRAVLRDGPRRRSGPPRRHAVQLRVVAVRGRSRPTSAACRTQSVAGPGRDPRDPGRARRATSRSWRRRRRRRCARMSTGSARYYEWVAEGTPSPLIERCFDWLEEHWPAAEGPTVLSWGDARIGNMMYRRVRAGRRARLGDGRARPARDRRRLVHLPAPLLRGHRDRLELPGMPHFLRRDDVVADLRAGQRRDGCATSTSTWSTPRCATAS